MDAAPNAVPTSSAGDQRQVRDVSSLVIVSRNIANWSRMRGSRWPAVSKLVGETWLQSGSAQISTPLQHAIDERLAWQRPKAVICSVLLVAFVVLFVFDQFPELDDYREPRPYRGRSDLPSVGVFAGRGPADPIASG